MKQMNDRIHEISQFLQPYMGECFQKSCELIRSEIEIRGNEIWKEIKSAIGKALRSLVSAQDRQQKGAFQYLVFSFLKSSIYLDRLVFYIECLDDRFYLDEEEASILFNIAFLEDKYRNDITYLHHKVKEKFIRLKEHELLYVNDQYASYYYAIAYRMIENLSELIMQEITGSDARISNKFKILYGEYMDSATVIYSRESQ